MDARNKIFCFILLISALATVAQANINCNITSSCNNVTLMQISDPLNGHAELPNQSNYANFICCNENGVELSNACSYEDPRSFFISINISKISSATNAHIEQGNLSTYTTPICIKTNRNTTFVYRSACDTDETCMFSISNATNAHVGNCNAYPLKLCTKTTQPITVGGGGGTVIIANVSLDPKTEIDTKNFIAATLTDSIDLTSNTSIPKWAGVLIVLGIIYSIAYLKKLNISFIESAILVLATLVLFALI